MAMANYNATLEYATNTWDFRLADADGVLVPFDGTTRLSIERADGSGASQTFNVQSGAGTDYIVFKVTPDKSILYKEGDTIYDLDNQVFEHIWSLRSNGNTYITGKMNLVEIAGN